MRISKKNILYLLIIVLGGFQIGCSSSDNSQIISISHGNSFGMCSGYCYTEKIYTPKYLITHRLAYRQKLPEKFDTIARSASKWNQLLSKLDLEAFKKLPGIIGCPDCADGGAEWVSIKTKDKIYKVTFDYDSNVKGLNDLLTLMRSIENPRNKK